MELKPESNLEHNFKMVAGGVAVIGGAIINSLLVRPVKSLFSLANGTNKKTSGSFVSDIMPFNHE